MKSASCFVLLVFWVISSASQSSGYSLIRHVSPGKYKARRSSRLFLQTRNTISNIHGDLDTNDQDAIRTAYSNIQVTSTGNRVLLPNEILHSELYRRVGYPTEKTKQHLPGLPLQRALEHISSSLKRIVQTLNRGIHISNTQEFVVDPSVLKEVDLLLAGGNSNSISSLWSTVSDTPSTSFRQPFFPAAANGAITDNPPPFFIIRIEQPLSHPVDPLCWLHANIPSSTMPNQEPNAPIFYLANAEGTFEAAACGSSITLHSLSSDDHVKNQDSSWKIIENLPLGSKVYGGSRFDNSLNTTIGDEWQDFGRAFWFLPAVELKRELATSSMTSRGEVELNSLYGTEHGQGSRDMSTTRMTTLSVHLHFSCPWSLLKSAQYILKQLEGLTYYTSPSIPCTTLPPIISRGANDVSQEVFENGVKAAIDLIDSTNLTDRKLEKVVLARKADLYLGTGVSGLDIMMKLRFGSHVGHLFFLYPGGHHHGGIRREFLGCTPERLFKINSLTGNDVYSEALAGTRPRGSTTESDTLLLQELMSSEKDLNENMITGNFIKKVFTNLDRMGLIDFSESNNNERDGVANAYFVRRLRHLQHICQSFEGRMNNSSNTIEISKYLMNNLHPTPAICGFPAKASLEFIQSFESNSFDRGLYAGPIGYLGKDYVDILVAIRSTLLSRAQNLLDQSDGVTDMTMSVYAGAGIVEGSTPQAEWSETSYKLEVLSSLFSQSPFSLQSAVNPNVAWASSFVEELIRCGVTQWYICPGSRSTPLTAAVAKALRIHVGIIQAISVHDERGAAFRALGYGRATNRPAVVITSSGTAVANLYPAIMEAGIDGIPLLILTADRPYENRDNGSNQSVDQVKVFSSTYIRWFRDIASPTDDIAISLALSDANHAVTMASQLRGPVHLNIQFQENLAPESGKIRGDNRIGSTTSFSHTRFTDVPGFLRWSTSGGKFLHQLVDKTSYRSERPTMSSAPYDVAVMIMKSQRGLIVVGNARAVTGKESSSDSSVFAASIAEFAEFVGFPVLCGAQAAQIRFQSAMVIPFGEHVLKHSAIKNALNPDLIIQIGATLVSTELQDLIVQSLKNNKRSRHILLHPHHPAERNDPSFTLTHKISADPVDFLESVQYHLRHLGADYTSLGSDILPIVSLGRAVGREMPSIIHSSSDLSPVEVKALNSAERLRGNTFSLTEPQIVLAMSEVLTMKRKEERKFGLFLSNSMPVRDTEFFLYPTEYESRKASLVTVAVNRGASGIDGILSSSIGFAEGTEIPTSLLIGDLATIHDLNSFHNLVRHKSTPSSPRQSFQLTAIIVNNDGGAIFSFLPIASHGSDVGFEEFFGTPTNAFSFVKGIEAFGLPVKSVSSYDSFKSEYDDALISNICPVRVIEARVVTRDMNVKVHSQINKKAINFLESHVADALTSTRSGVSFHSKLAIKTYGKVEIDNTIDQASSSISSSHEKILVLLHGWMGDKEDWDEIGISLTDKLSTWRVISIDLPGHGNSTYISNALQNSLGATGSGDASIEDVAAGILRSLHIDHGIQRVDALCGYSLGGRIAMEMKRLCSLEEPSSASKNFALITPETKVILISADPGISLTHIESETRLRTDYQLASQMFRLHQKLHLSWINAGDKTRHWIQFVDKWYDAAIWGDMKKRKPDSYRKMTIKRSMALASRALDFAEILRICSPGTRSAATIVTNYGDKQLFFIAGSLDEKYSRLGKQLHAQSATMKYNEIADSGHAVLVEAPRKVSELLYSILEDETIVIEPKLKENINERIPNMSSSLGFSQDYRESLTVGKNPPLNDVKPFHLEYDRFSIELGTSSGERNGVTGIGWGDKSKGSLMKERQGFIISLSTADNLYIGVGEVSPLDGVHHETVYEAQSQIELLKERLMRLTFPDIPSLPCESILALDGSLELYIHSLYNQIFPVGDFTNDTQLLPSVRAGLEMALLSIASQAEKMTLVDAILRKPSVPTSNDRIDSPMLLPLNGLVTKDETSSQSRQNKQDRVSYTSTKVKVGESSPFEDAQRMLRSVSEQTLLRADANRSWNETQAFDFVMFLKALDPSSIDSLEFVEEPLIRVGDGKKAWDLGDQLEALERFYDETGIKYALDESLADIAMSLDFKFQPIADKLLHLFHNRTLSGCAALILKPSLLGLELSARLASLAHEVLGIGTVYSSTLDSGVGLGYISILAQSSDYRHSKSGRKRFAHGLSTFSLLSADTLSPPFANFVTKDGSVDILPLSNALQTLTLDDMRESFTVEEPREIDQYSEEDFQVSSLSSSSGREISVQVSLPLPFAEDIAYDRFTDLPQQPRWSPWLKSVSYLKGGDETEWTLNIKGIEFRWRATRKLLSNPRGVMWESTSGLKNKGLVEFVKSSDSSCFMKLKMRIIVPRVVSTIFRSTGEFVKEFVENKLLKWSLESFRDVVKADLALQRGDAELGDALYGAVEGRTNAIEATLSP